MTNVPEHADRKPETARFHGIVVPRWELAIRWTAGTVFLGFGIGKFVNHPSELASFRLYGLPLPGVFAYAIGSLEIVGGLLLVSRRLLRWAALALAIDMVGAILVSGIGQGELISLMLAPALLVAMIFLLHRASVDRHLTGQLVGRGRGVEQ